MVKQINNWYKKLLSEVNTISEQFELDEIQTATFRDFAVKISKEQFKNGSRSGAAWAFKQKHGVEKVMPT